MKNWFRRDRERHTPPVRVEPEAKRRQEPRVRVRYAAAAKPTIDVQDALAPYVPPPGVRGNDAPTHLAMDDGALVGSMDQLAGWAGTNPNLMVQYVEDGLSFLGYPQLAQMAQRAEFRKPCEVIAREATREWIEFRSDKQSGDVHANKNAADRIKELEGEFERLGVRAVIRTHIMHGLLYGLGHLWVGIKDVPLTSEAQSVPLVASSTGMKRGMLERLKNIEPIWTTPNKYESNQVLARDFYVANNWWMLGTLVDSSRVITIVPYPVSQILAPAFNFGGQSLTQLLRAYVHNYLATRNATASIVRNFSKLVLKTDMTGNMQTDAMSAQPLPYGDVDMASVQGRAAYMQDVAEGQSTIVVDKEREDAGIIATPLSGLDALQAQAMEAMASIPGIPLVKLFGIQPTGLNASSEGEIRVFYDEISSFQEAHVRPALQRIFELVQINLWGEIDDTLSFDFVPLWQMDEKQLAEIEKIKADLVALYLTAGVVAPEEAREREAVDDRSIFRGVDLSGPPPEPPEGPDDSVLEGLMKRGEEEE